MEPNFQPLYASEANQQAAAELRTYLCRLKEQLQSPEPLSREAAEDIASEYGSICQQLSTGPIPSMTGENL